MCFEYVPFHRRCLGTITINNRTRSVQEMERCRGSFPKAGWSVESGGR